MSREQVRSSNENEGEGNKTAARRYNKEATKSAQQHKGEKKGPEAAEALDGPEAEEMRDAERKGRQPLRRAAKA
jgi:hypothetical protein